MAYAVRPGASDPWPRARPRSTALDRARPRSTALDRAQARSGEVEHAADLGPRTLAELAVGRLRAAPGHPPAAVGDGLTRQDDAVPGPGVGHERRGQVEGATAG